MEDLRYYWREYFKVFSIVPKKVRQFYSLLSNVDGDNFDLFLTSVIIKQAN